MTMTHWPSPDFKRAQIMAKMSTPERRQIAKLKLDLYRLNNREAKR